MRKVSEWMTDVLKLELSPKDVAIRLDLISKVRGLEQAEEFFNSIPSTQRGMHIYGSLLNCYAHGKALEKAETSMQQLRDLGFAGKSLPYNVMLNLFSHMGKHEQMNLLMHEMDEKGISYDEFTYSIRLNAFASASDIEGMENFVAKMESDSRAKFDWNAYVAAANGYMKAGLVEKAMSMVQ